MDTKKWYKSKTVIGGIVLMLGVVFKQLGRDFDNGSITEIVQGIMDVVGLILVYIGRIKAEGKIVG